MNKPRMEEDVDELEDGVYEVYDKKMGRSGE